MCLLLDVNSLSPFFNETDPNHNNFSDAKLWITDGNGKLVFGGTKYKEELKRAGKYLRIFAALEKAGRIVMIDDETVDECEEIVRGIEPSAKFDDPHLIAIIRVSRCRILCTNDERAIPYIKENRFYPKSVKKPKLYRYKSHRSMLIEKNIAEICKC